LVIILTFPSNAKRMSKAKVPLALIGLLTKY